MRAGMNAQLLVLADPLSGERSEHPLIAGAPLSAELMRLFPEGIEGDWRIFRGEVQDASEIEKAGAESIVVASHDFLIMVRTPGTPNIWVQIGIAVFLSMASFILGPHPYGRPRNPEQTDDSLSGSNVLAGQSNVLRPGGRVPEILGSARVYPDLLTYPIETWSRRTQQIEQFFVIGRGSYDVTEAKLGESLIRSLGAAGFVTFQPGASTPQIRVVKEAVEVAGVSLMTEEGSQVAPQGVNFAAGANTMTTINALDLQANDFVVVRITAQPANTGIFRCTAASGAGPFVYTLDRALANEINASPLLELFDWRSRFNTGITLNGNTVQRVGGTSTGPGPFPSNGWLCDFNSVADGNVRGYIRNMTIVSTSPRIDQWQVEKLDGTLYNFGAQHGAGPSTVDLDFLMPLGEHSGGSTPAGPAYGAPTNWYRAPLDDADEVWVDISFPQGLVNYNSGVRAFVSVQVKIEICRPGAGVAQYSETVTYNDNTTGPLRFTETYKISDLGLPAGTGAEVRVSRVSAILVDTATNQYFTETRLERLASMKRLDAHFYQNVTIGQLAMTNTRSAVSLGSTALNCVATRKLKTWSAGSGWSATAAATRKWADSFVERCEAADGAGRVDAEIDLAGIYALQAQLDALDGGAQGQISMVIDQEQDIDSELSQIADVVRSVVYRVGRKIYVTRDQANATPLALFNGRTKTAEGESVAMRMKSDDEYDGVRVQWVDELSGWKRREYQYSLVTLPTNVLRLSASLANWPQAYRRARFEFNKILYRREQISCAVTEDGRICRPGDVVHITDDIGNLALDAGEVLNISGTQLLVDRDLDFSAAGTYSILLRDLKGLAIDLIPCTAVAGSPNRVQLARAPSGIAIKGRDEALGTLYAFYNDARVTARQWLLSGVEISTENVVLSGVNYTARVYEGDGASLPVRPLLSGVPPP